MKVRFRNPKKPEEQAKKFLTIKVKYKRFRLATIILSGSWIIREIVRYDKEIWQAIQNIINNL